MMQQVSNFGQRQRDKGRHRTGEHTFNWEVSEIMIPSQMHVKEITSGTGLQWSAFSVLSVTEFQTFTLNSDCFPYLRMHKGFLGKCQNVMSVLGHASLFHEDLGKCSRTPGWMRPTHSKMQQWGFKTCSVHLQMDAGSESTVLQNFWLSWGRAQWVAQAQINLQQRVQCYSALSCSGYCTRGNKRPIPAPTRRFVFSPNGARGNTRPWVYCKVQIL